MCMGLARGRAEAGDSIPCYFIGRPQVFFVFAIFQTGNCRLFRPTLLLSSSYEWRKPFQATSSLLSHENPAQTRFHEKRAPFLQCCRDFTLRVTSQFPLHRRALGETCQLNGPGSRGDPASDARTVQRMARSPCVVCKTYVNLAAWFLASEMRLCCAGKDGFNAGRRSLGWGSARDTLHGLPRDLQLKSSREVDKRGELALQGITRNASCFAL